MTLSYVAIMASSQPLQYEFERESVVRGQIICRIIGHRRYGNGLEVPCVYIFRSSSSKDITKLKTLMATPRETLNVIDTSQNIEP